MGNAMSYCSHVCVCVCAYRCAQRKARFLTSSCLKHQSQRDSSSSLEMRRGQSLSPPSGVTAPRSRTWQPPPSGWVHIFAHIPDKQINRLPEAESGVHAFTGSVFSSPIYASFHLFVSCGHVFPLIPTPYLYYLPSPQTAVLLGSLLSFSCMLVFLQNLYIGL